jgi:hypothetical protein
MLRSHLDSQEHGAPCRDCGKSDVILTHGVFDDGNPFAMAIVRFSPHRQDREATLNVILADRDTGEPADEFSMRVIAMAEDVGASFVDVPDGLTRDEALAHPRKGDALDVFNCLVKSDAVLRRFLDRPGYDA